MALEVNGLGSLVFVEHRIHVNAGHRAALGCLVIISKLMVTRLHMSPIHKPQL